MNMLPKNISRQKKQTKNPHWRAKVSETKQGLIKHVIYIRRLGPFRGFKILNFNWGGGGGQKMNIFLE